MANDASVTIKATVLPDDIAKTISGAVVVAPVDANDKWYYKLTSVPAASQALIAGSYIDYTAVDSSASPDTVDTADKVNFLFVKNTDAAESVYIIPPASSVTAGSFTIGTDYVITSSGTTDFTLIGAADSNVGTAFTATGATVTAGSFVIGRSYEIVNAGTTDFTLIGAADSNVGTIFTATGVGVGDGTADEEGVAGTGTGTAELPASITTTGFHIGPSEALTIRLPNQTVGNIHAASSAGTVSCIVAALLDDVA